MKTKILKETFLLILLLLALVFAACTTTKTTPIGSIGDVYDLSAELPKGVKVPANVTTYSQLVRMENIDISVTVRWSCFEDSTGKYIKSVEFVNDKATIGFEITPSLFPQYMNRGADGKVLMSKAGNVKGVRISTFRYIERNTPFEIRADGTYTRLTEQQ